MTLEQSGKGAVVTGGGSGIGLAFVQHLVSKGCAVVISDLALTPEAQALTESHKSVSFHKTDVTSWKQLSQLWKYAAETLPSVDIVCPAAGIFDHPSSRFWEPPRTATNPDSRSQDDADGEPGHYRVLDINLAAPMRLAQLAIGHWTKAKQKGCLVFVGSIAGFAGGLGRPLYHASKFGIHGFVQSLAPLRDEAGIRSGAVAPGAVKTPLWDGITQPETGGWTDIQSVVDAMYRLVVDEELGDGQILQVVQSGTTVQTSASDSMRKAMHSQTTLQNEILQRLQTTGLDV